MKTLTIPYCVLITGANGGLGFECARQLASINGIEKILLGCRNVQKATEAKERLEKLTNKRIFEIVIIDVSNLISVKRAIKQLTKENVIDGVVLNAGGAGGPEPMRLTADGVTSSIAVNLLGHVLLIDDLIKGNKISGKAASVIFAGSESSRGVPEMSLPSPKLESGSIEEFMRICDGSFFTKEEQIKNHVTLSRHIGSYAKFVGTLWMSSMARKHCNIRFVTISPGANSSTNVMRDNPWYTRLFIKMLGTIMTFTGTFNTLEKGAKRYVDALLDHSTYQSGVFYASKKGLSGEMSDQSTILDYFVNEAYQDNAYEAIHKFIKK